MTDACFVFLYRLQKPCADQEEVNFKCAPPFSYRHTLSLTADTKRFQAEVTASAVSGNLDSPEGGFDAIMQAVVCGDRIGWRKDARKLLMFSTDASFHFAGDGRLGGILEPHDGKCHLDGNGDYTHDWILDYPSIAQINSKVTEKSIAIIFAVTRDQLRDYERLSRQIQGSTAGELSANSSNVVELVNQEYEKISSEVKLSHTLDEGSSPVRLSFYSHCGGSEGATVEGGRCGGVRIGETVSFTAQLLLDDCPAGAPGTKANATSFVIQVVGIDEQLVVDVDFADCGCKCEEPGQKGYETRSHACGMVGTLKCGACDCSETDYYGKFCQCSVKSGSDGSSLSTGFISTCRDANATVDCSDRGECLCGACDCQSLPANPDEKYYGKYCQCDDFSCRRVNGQLCSGREHGKCLCSECKCESGWTGDACDCSTSTIKCRGGGGSDTLTCSGRGRCECNRCLCDSPEYSGPLCEECQTCPDKCTAMAKCVLCSVKQNNSGLVSDLCSTECLPYPSVEVVEFAPTSSGKYCSAVDAEDDCTYYYSYAYDPVTSEVRVKAQKVKSCALLGGAGGWWLGGGIVVLILILGLLAFLCLWCFRERQARQEYAKFNEDKSTAKWDRAENPLYRSPHTTFNNPLHESNQKEKYY